MVQTSHDCQRTLDKSMCSRTVLGNLGQRTDNQTKFQQATNRISGIPTQETNLGTVKLQTTCPKISNHPTIKPETAAKIPMQMSENHKPTLKIPSKTTKFKNLKDLNKPSKTTILMKSNCKTSTMIEPSNTMDGAMTTTTNIGNIMNGNYKTP